MLPVGEVRTSTAMIQNKRRAVLIGAMAGVVLTIGVILFVTLRMGPERALLNVMSDRVDLQVRNVRFTEVGDSGMKWEIIADAVRYQKNDNLALFEKVKVRLLMRDGMTFLMEGDHGRLNTESRDMDLEGNVSIVSDKGDRFMTDRLRYRNGEKVIETDRPVVMEYGSVRISGIGMVVSLDGKEMTILSQVKASAMGETRGKP